MRRGYDGIVCIIYPVLFRDDKMIMFNNILNLVKHYVTCYLCYGSLGILTSNHMPSKVWDKMMKLMK